jgi:nucleolin
LRVGGVFIAGGGREQGIEIDGKLQVRNISTGTTEAELAEFFAQAGLVAEVRIVRDGLSGMSRGYGFVTMSSVNEADAAVSRLNGRSLQGYVLKVILAKARSVRGGLEAASQDRGQGR